MKRFRVRRATIVALVVAASAGWWWIGRDRVWEVPFAPLPVSGGPEEDLTWSPLAPAGFPDCTIGMLDLRVEGNSYAASVTARPKEGVQCGLDWRPEAWWIDANGDRIEVPRERGRYPGRLLVMGAAGAKISGTIETGCGLEPPLTFFLDFAGTPFEVGTIEKPDCYGRRTRFGSPTFQYREGGLETPAGWLDPSIDDPSVSRDRIEFVLALTNDTSETITMSRCPFIKARVVTESGESTIRSFLNCPGAPDDIGPGDVVRFHLELQIDGEMRSIELEIRDERRLLHRVPTDEIVAAA